MILLLVGHGLGTTLPCNTDTPPNSPSSNRIEINIDNHRHQRKTSTGSSPSRTSSDDDSRQTVSMPFASSVTARQKITTTNRPVSSSVTNGAAFKMMSISQNICPRCSKTVYSAEEVKAAGKVSDHHLFVPCFDDSGG